MKQPDNRTAAIRIIRTLRDRGHEAYLVGGCVRDMLLGRRRKKDEHDVATSARTEEVISLFPKTLLVGAQFGVVLVGMGGQWIEVASFRCDEGYTDGRHPDRVRIGSLREDAERRDFTVNGLYYDPIEDRLIDLVGGRADLEKHLLRAIGNPEARFGEDHLRMLRAVRFAGQLSGFQIESETAQAIRRLADRITGISAERILEELKKLLTADHRVTGLILAEELGLLRYILPEVSGLHGVAAGSLADEFSSDALAADAFDQTLAALRELPDDTDVPVALAALLHLAGGVKKLPPDFPVWARPNPKTWVPSAKLTDMIARRLGCSNRERIDTVWLVHLLPLLGRTQRLSLAPIKRLMMYGHHEGLIRLYRARVQAGLEPRENLDAFEQTVRRIDPASLAAPPLLTGQDLTDTLNLVPGPGYQRILDMVYDAQLNEEIKTKQEALALAGKISESASFNPKSKI